MDETQPLLAPVPPPTTAAGQFPYIPDVNVPNDESFDHRVDFNPNGDPENPLEWPKAYHNGVILLLAFMAFTVYARISYHPTFNQTSISNTPSEHAPVSV